MKKLCFSILAALFVLLAWNWSSVNAFQPVTATVNTQSPLGQSNRAIGLASNRNKDPLHEAMEKLKAAEDSNEKEEAMDAIRVGLEKQYDQFLEDNEKQIEQLQERLDKLRDQLVRRKSAKNKMVDLEIERVVNESEGLVWPGQSSRTSRFPGGLFFDRTPNRAAPAPPNPALAPGRSTSGFRVKRPGFQVDRKIAETEIQLQVALQRFGSNHPAVQSLRESAQMWRQFRENEKTAAPFSQSTR